MRIEMTGIGVVRVEQNHYCEGESSEDIFSMFFGRQCAASCEASALLVAYDQ